MPTIKVGEKAHPSVRPAPHGDQPGAHSRINLRQKVEDAIRGGGTKTVAREAFVPPSGDARVRGHGLLHAIPARKLTACPARIKRCRTRTTLKLSAASAARVVQLSCENSDSRLRGRETVTGRRASRLEGALMPFSVLSFPCFWRVSGFRSRCKGRPVTGTIL